MRNDDIKKRLRQSASSIEVPDNLQATLSKLPDSLPIVEPKRKSKPAWLYPLLGGSAAVLLLGVAIGVPLGLRSNKVDIGGGSTPPGVSYNLTQKEVADHLHCAPSSLAMIPASRSFSTTRRFMTSTSPRPQGRRKANTFTKGLSAICEPGRNSP